MTSYLAREFLGPAARLGLAGQVPPADFQFDGCSCAPDHIAGIDLRPACMLHDWAYARLRFRHHETGRRMERERAVADARFLANLVRCGLGDDVLIRFPSLFVPGGRRITGRKVAGVYYRRVRLWGARAIGWRLSWWEWLRIAVTRYVTPE